MSLKHEEIPFNRPFIAGKELYYIAQAVTLGNLGGDGHFTSRCCRYLEERFGIEKALLTPSCTAALEMAAMLCELQPGDEVIMPSYTFVSTASAFVREGARPVFVDIRPDTLNIDEELIEAAITARTKAICVVHYAGVACEMDPVINTAQRHGLVVIEDAAQAVNSFYKGRPLGTIGHIGCYSFHETKNVICGEGGALCLNDKRFIQRAEIIHDKGTNRQEFFRGEVDKYTWVDVGSSYVPSELCSAFLFAQLEEMTRISKRRREIYLRYMTELRHLEAKGLLTLPIIPDDRLSNYHLFYVLLPSRDIRDQVIAFMKDANVRTVFHYVPLHSSPKGRELCGEGSLPVTEDIAFRLVRLPLFHDMTTEEQTRCIDSLTECLNRVEHVKRARPSFGSTVVS